jgi:hypothetical protein
MHLQHTDPEGAVNMAKFMNVKKSVGVHWGTWIMSDELCRYYARLYVQILILDRQPTTKRLGYRTREVGRFRTDIQRRASRTDYRYRLDLGGA